MIFRVESCYLDNLRKDMSLRAFKSEFENILKELYEPILWVVFIFTVESDFGNMDHAFCCNLLIPENQVGKQKYIPYTVFCVR